MIMPRKYSKDSNYMRLTAVLSCPNHRILHKKDGILLNISPSTTLFSTVSKFLVCSVTENPFDIMYKLDNGLSLDK